MRIAEHEFYIRGKPATREDVITLLNQSDGFVFTLGSSEPDNASRAIWTDGVDVYKTKEEFVFDV